MRSLLCIVLVASCGSPDPEPACTSFEIADALASAQSGDTVQICAGDFEGVFEVPPGVTVVGAGSRAEEGGCTFVMDGSCLWPGSSPWTDATRLSAPRGEKTLTIHGRAGITTTIRDLSLVGGVAAIDAEDPGDLVLERLWIRQAVGLAVLVKGASSATLSEVTVRGGMNEANQGEWTDTSDPTLAPIAGVSFEEVADAELESVDVRGFMLAAVQSTSSTLGWSGGAACESKNGLLVHGGAATIYDVDVCDLLPGFSLLPPLGFAIADGANVQTTRVRVVGGGGDGVGLYQEGSTSQHQNLVVTDHDSTGVFLYQCRGTTDLPAFSLTGPDSEISRNRGVGVLVVESTGVVIDGARIDDTTSQRRIVGDLSDVEVGDGIEVIQCACNGGESCPEPLADIRLAHLTMAGNSRLGIAVDANAGSAAGVEVEDLHVSSEGTAYGAIVQHSSEPPVGWDTEIVRSGAADANDAAFVEPLSVLSSCRP